MVDLLASVASRSAFSATAANPERGLANAGGLLPAEGLLLVVGMLFQLGVIGYFATNFDQAIPRLTPDDAFYYLKIADNVAHGLGSVFSPGEPTNGYHPLWMVMLAGIGLFNPSPVQYVVATLVLAAASNLLGATFLIRLLTEIGCSPAQRVLGLALYLVSPPMVCLTLCGVETPILLAALTAFFLWAHRVLWATEGLWKQSIGLGIASGILMLARTDTIFFTSITYLFLWYRLGRRGLGPLTFAGAIASFVLSPWLIWCYWTFGTIMQSSAGSMPALWRWYAFSVDRSPSEWMYYYATQLFAPLYHLFFGPLYPWVVDPRIKIPLILLGIVSVALYARFGTKRLLPGFPWMIWATPGVLLLLFCAWVRLFVHPWHLASLLLTAILGTTMLAQDRWLRGRRLVLLSIALVLITITSLQNCYFHFTQRNSVVEAREFMADNPRRLRIGCTDCGFLSFFSKHEFVNLDGVVNNRAEQAIQAGRLSDYLESEHFDRVMVDLGRLPFYDRNRRQSAAILTAPQGAIVDAAKPLTAKPLTAKPVTTKPVTGEPANRAAPAPASGR